jgi:hypothetical protein
MSSKKKFNVGVSEVFVTWITVEAESIDEARLLARKKMQSGGEIPESEYSHALDKDNWIVIPH